LETVWAVLFIEGRGGMHNKVDSGRLVWK